MNAPNCPDCNIPMEQGHILDQNRTTPTFSHWQPGPVVPENFLWIADVPGTAQIDSLNWRQVVSYCCPQCRLLREYAMDID